MKKGRGKLLLATFFVALALMSCSSDPANDPAVAAGVMTNAGYGAETGTVKSIVSAKTFSSGVGSFTGSANVSAASKLAAVAVVFANQSVTYNNNTYTINGTMNYAFESSPPDVTGSFSFTAYIYASGISIKGADYDGSFSADFKETVTMTRSGTGYSMSIAVSGNIDNQIVSQTITTTY